MREIEWCVYVREYSALPGLQEAGSIRYSLSRDQAGSSLRVERYSADGSRQGREQQIRLNGISDPAAEQLLRYLYENGVEPSSAPAVLEDCLQSAVLQPV